jgi:hypothetical protein
MMMASTNYVNLVCIIVQHVQLVHHVLLAIPLTLIIVHFLLRINVLV